MKLEIANFLFFMFFLYVAGVRGVRGILSIPLCENTTENLSDHDVLYYSKLSSGSRFCFCTMQSNHSFRLEIKRIQSSTNTSQDDSQANMYFYNGSEDNKTCERINLMDVYKKPLHSDCLARFSPNQSSPLYCWTNTTNMSAFGFFQNLSSYMKIYLTVIGNGAIHTNCSHSSEPPPELSSLDRCREDNSSSQSTQTNAGNNTVLSKEDNLENITIQSTSEMLITNAYGTTEQNLQKADHFNMTEVGILLASIGAVFLLFSVILFALTFRKRSVFSSKKKDPSTKDNLVKKKISRVSTVTDNESTLHCEDITENDISPWLVRKTSSLHEAVYKLPLSRRFTDGHIDMDMHQLEKKPHYTAMKNLNSKEDGTGMLSNVDTRNQYVETEADKNKRLYSTVNDCEQDTNENVNKFNTTKENIALMNPFFVSKDKTIENSMKSYSAKQNQLNDNSVDKGLGTVYELDLLPSGKTDGKSGMSGIHGMVQGANECSMTDSTKDLHINSNPQSPPQVRVKQARSVDGDLSDTKRIKPDAPKRSMSDETFLKSSDAFHETESQNESEQENHLYEDVDELKESTDLTEICNTPAESYETRDERKQTVTISHDDEDDKEMSLDGETHDNRDVDVYQENLDHLIDNELYSMGSDDFTWRMNATEEENEKDEHINNVSLDHVTKCDASTLGNNQQSTTYSKSQSANSDDVPDVSSPGKRSPDKSNTPDKSTFPCNKTNVDVLGKCVASESTMITFDSDKITSHKQDKVSDRKNEEIQKHPVSSVLPSLPTEYEEPDYDTISYSSDETESTIELQKQTENANNKPSDRKLTKTQNIPVEWKESVKVIFLRPKALVSSKEENSHPWLYPKEKTTPPQVRVKQARSVDGDLSDTKRIKPDAPKRSMSDETFLKSSDAFHETESQNESEQENHLYEDVDELKESTDLTEICNTPAESYETRDERKQTVTISHDDEDDKEMSLDGETHDNRDVDVYQENLDHLIDNELYSMGSDDFTWRMNATEEENEKDEHINNVSLDHVTKCDASTLGNNLQNENSLPNHKTTVDHVIANEDHMIDNDLYSMNIDL